MTFEEENQYLKEAMSRMVILDEKTDEELATLLICRLRKKGLGFMVAFAHHDKDEYFFEYWNTFWCRGAAIAIQEELRTMQDERMRIRVRGDDDDDFLGAET